MSRCAGHQVLSILCRLLVIGSHLTGAGDIRVRHVSLEYASWNSEQLLPSLVSNGRQTGEFQRVPPFCVLKHWNASITERVAVTVYFCQHKPHIRQELLTTRKVVKHPRVFCKFLLLYFQREAKLHSLFLKNCSTCFGWYLHPSSGAHNLYLQ